MADVRRTAPKGVVIDALVMAFSNSGLREVVGSDALRTVVNAQYLDIMHGHVFRSQPLYNLLAEQPGFDADMAAPPFCLFKAWESKLGIEVVLPDELAALTHGDRSRRAAEVRVPEKELALVFDPKLAADLKRAQEEKRAALATHMTVEEDTDELPPAKKAMFGGAILISLVSLAFVAFTLYMFLRPVPVQTVDPASIGLPLTDTVRLGNQIGGTLADPNWLSLSREEREVELKAALERAGADVLFIKDGPGRVYVTVQQGQNGPVVRWLASRR